MRDNRLLCKCFCLFVKYQNSTGLDNNISLESAVYLFLEITNKKNVDISKKKLRSPAWSWCICNIWCLEVNVNKLGYILIGDGVLKQKILLRS